MKRYAWVAIFGIAVMGCSGSHAPSPDAGTAAPSPPPAAGAGSEVTRKSRDVDTSGSARVSYLPNVRILNPDAASDSLRGLSTNGLSLVFDSADAQIRLLKAGDVLMIKGLLARKVIGTETAGGETLVLTQPAAITDVVKQGHISVRAATHFTSPPTSASEGHAPLTWWSSLLPGTTAMAADAPWSNNTRNPSLPEPTPSVGNHPPSAFDQTIDQAGAILSPFKSLLDGWDIDWEATPADNRVNLDLSMTKTVDGVAANITAKGYLSNFEFVTDIDVGDASSSASAAVSTLKQAAGKFKNLNGAMDLTWTIGIDVAGEKNGRTEIKLPGALSVPLAPVLDGIPLSLEVSGAIIIEPAFTARKQITSGTYHITYDGYQDFKMSKGAGLTSDGEMKGQLDYQPQEGLSAAAPFGMTIGLGAPRIQLEFGGAEAFKMEGLKDAAKTVDTWAAAAAKRVLSPESYKLFTDSGASLSAAVAAVQSTGATVFVRVVSTSATTHSGMSVIIPCSHTDFTFDVSVGGSASAFGISTGDLSKRVIDKTYTQNVPANVKLCQSIG
jgi:hypothetical protein